MPSVKSRENDVRKPGTSRRASNASRPEHDAQDARRRSAITLGWGLLGSLLLWLSLPPVGWWPLAWIAPVPWLALVRRRELPGRRPYPALYLAGLAFWLGALHWLRLPHPETSLGWIALSGYLGCYLPVFVALSRVAVHELRISILIAAPAIWAGLELAQSHLLTGINIATPGHSQYRWIELIQISDLAGGYGVSFVIMFVAACLVRMLSIDGARRVFWPLVAAAMMLAATLTYGHFRMAGEHLRPGLKIALIQGSIDSEMKSDPKQAEKIHEQYLALSDRAVREHRDLDLIVWPETMFREPLRSYTPDVRPPEGVDWTKADLQSVIDDLDLALAHMADRYKVPMLLGMDTIIYGDRNVDRYNSAVLIDKAGRVEDRYDKMRPIMFGEYIPLGTYIPWLYKLTPLADGLDCGTRPKSLSVAGVRIAPNICFETLLPHFIRGQVQQLRAEDAEPDLLVNLTNDGWFWGSSELDMHLMCGVFRAVECRKPMVIAANTGFSAVIDADGRILAQGPRRATDVLAYDVQLDSRRSPYVAFGDWGAGICLLFGVALGAVGIWRSHDRARKSSSATT
ncbi:MAG TPA: apolipoprotein N-acyltransferase [Pirellulales bacterium]|nr:apolipoprotein N-acyltransferase [Pirellulales bacterium]